jgi:hypothetical protein
LNENSEKRNALGYENICIPLAQNINSCNNKGSQKLVIGRKTAQILVSSLLFADFEAATAKGPGDNLGNISEKYQSMIDMFVCDRQKERSKTKGRTW